MFRLIALFIITSLGLFSVSAHAEFKRLHVTDADASSYLKNNWSRFSENYHPNYAFDDNAKTAWVEGADGNGIGETLRFEVSKNPAAKTLKLRFRNGYQKSNKLMKANAAATTFSLLVMGPDGRESYSGNIKVPAKKGFSDVKVPLSHGVAKVSLKIEKVRSGSLYKDTCLSDVQVFVDVATGYKASVEKSKQKALKSWAQERVAAAASFKAKPSAFAFASPEFRLDEAGATYIEHKKVDYDSKSGKEKVNSSFVPAMTQLKKGTLPLVAKGLTARYAALEKKAALFRSKKGSRYRVETGKSGKGRIPDELRWSLKNIEVFFGTPLPDFAETSRRIQSSKKFNPPNNDMRILEERSTAHVERKEGALVSVMFTTKEIVEERTTETFDVVYDLHFEKDRLVSADMLSRSEAGDGFSHWHFTRNDAGKVVSVTTTFAAGYREYDFESASFGKRTFHALQ